MSEIQPRVAIVTGASRGIGLAIARALVERGDRVCITGRDPQTLAEAVAGLGRDSGADGASADRASTDGASADRALFVAGKAHDPAHQEEAVARTLEHYGRIDYLVNNVGTNPVFSPMLDLDGGLVRKILEINVVAAFEWIQRVHAAWLGANGGAVVNVASLAGMRPAVGLGAYGVSKAALIHLTQQLAMELAPAVRVNAVAPAVVKTRFAEALYAGREDEAAAGYPAGRLGVPSDVASAVAFLLSDEASWITGQTLVLDGGSSLIGRMA